MPSTSLPKLNTSQKPFTFALSFILSKISHERSSEQRSKTFWSLFLGLSKLSSWIIPTVKSSAVFRSLRANLGILFGWPSLYWNKSTLRVTKSFTERETSLTNVSGFETLGYFLLKGQVAFSTPEGVPFRKLMQGMTFGDISLLAKVSNNIIQRSLTIKQLSQSHIANYRPLPRQTSTAFSLSSLKMQTMWLSSAIERGNIWRKGER